MILITIEWIETTHYRETTLSLLIRSRVVEELEFCLTISKYVLSSSPLVHHCPSWLFPQQYSNILGRKISMTSLGRYLATVSDGRIQQEIACFSKRAVDRVFHSCVCLTTPRGRGSVCRVRDSIRFHVRSAAVDFLPNLEFTEEQLTGPSILPIWSKLRLWGD